MESRIRSIFLVRVLLAATGCLCLGVPALAQDNSAGQADQAAPRVIEPSVQRRSVDVSKIDTEDWEVTGFIGIMSIEDFEADAVYGARLAYHINETFFAEATYGSSEAGTSSFERLQSPAQLLDNRDYTYYDLSLGYNVLPGEVFFGEKRAFNSALYLIGGMGSTDFAEENNFTINFGFGIKFLLTDYLAIRLDARDYLFDTEVTGEDKTTHNLQGTLNVSYFF